MLLRPRPSSTLVALALGALAAGACSEEKAVQQGPAGSVVSKGGSGGAGQGGKAAASSGGQGAVSTGNKAGSGGAGSGPVAFGGASPGTGGSQPGTAGQAGVGQGAGSPGSAGAAGMMAQAGAPPVDPCAGVTCSGHGTCSAGSCICDPGYVAQGTSCSLPQETCSVAACPAGSTCEHGVCYCDDPATPAGSCWPRNPPAPETHTEPEVCAAWALGRQITEGNPWTAGPSECDPGTLSPKAIFDTLHRLALMRWLAGIAPAGEDVGGHATYQAGAILAAFNPPGTVPDAHHPPSTAKCFTQQGLAGTSSSNLAWGSGHPAEAIDQFMVDSGNYQTFGHRRWLIFPSLGNVGVGFVGTGSYGSCECLGVFGGGTSSPDREFWAWPPPGPVPLEVAQMVWTFHTNKGIGQDAKLTAKAASDPATVLTAETMPLWGGFGMDAVAFMPQFNVAAGETYTVTVEGVNGGSVTYDVKPIACQ